MKKSKKIGLSLNKKVVTKFTETSVTGGGTLGCTGQGHSLVCTAQTECCGASGISCNPFMCKYK